MPLLHVFRGAAGQLGSEGALGRGAASVALHPQPQSSWEQATAPKASLLETLTQEPESPVPSILPAPNNQYIQNSSIIFQTDGFQYLHIHFLVAHVHYCTITSHRGQ